MSNKKVIIFNLISIILFLHFSCKNNDESTIVGYHKNVMDSICKKNQSKIDQFCNEILAIPEIKNGLNAPSIDENSKTFNFDKYVIENGQEIIRLNEFIDPKLNISSQNSFLVTKYSNITSNLGKQISTDFNNLNFKFNLRLFNEIKPDYSNLTRIWDCYQEKNLLNNLQGSLTANTKKELIQKSNLFLNTISNAKYYVYVEDQFCFMPELLDDNTFTTGSLVTSVKIFETKTNKKIAQKTFCILNSESVTTVKNTNQKIDEMAVKFDLVHNRNQKINEYLFSSRN